ncbi:MAG: bifunctional folylpolyglutamate synthase/dihydrofolate synthase [Candidatus Eremiobacteraeota bacterium]|nr:bifunctional folylpolyglutamate synthase/dihydrofolate synthase [Candidatus Eremiobacteraeota bacterium]
MAASPFERAEAYLLGTISESASPRTSYKLDRMRRLLKELGDPHLAYPVVHVGGTSGKGSTCTMIAAVLQAGGKRTGLHTKPHLHSMTERARVDSFAIDPDALAGLLDAMMPAIERTARAGLGTATYYETLLALAFMHFARERVDVAVIEVGLGGRLDGTNLVAPEVTALTSVGYDHTDVLGETLDAIAREKAGIAKRGVPLVVADVPSAAFTAIRRVAESAGAPIVCVRDHARLESVLVEPDHQSFVVATGAARYRLQTPVLGVFQRTNAATAIVALEQLRGGLAVGPPVIEAAFSQLVIPGRMEAFTGAPTVVFDIAHNAEKAEHLVASLRESFPGKRMQYVVAIGESKDARRILATLASIANAFTLTSFHVSGRRAAEPAHLEAIARSLGFAATTVEEPVAALERARRRALAGDVVVVTGSTFVVAALRDWWIDRVGAAAGSC